MKTAFIFGIALAGLTACGPLQSNNRISQLGQSIASGIGGGDSTDPAVASTGGGITREQIEAAPADLMRLSIISREATALIVSVAENGSKVTWISPDQISFVFDRGVLVGTRGLGDDLMGSDVSGVVASLNGGGNHIRTHDYLDGLDQIERPSYQCVTVQTDRENITIFDRTYATTVMEESCTGDAYTFKNTYWRDANGVIWQSRQWISVDVGYLGYQRL